MCTACLMADVKNRMLSRRSLFTGAAATAALGATSGLLSARPALAQATGRVVDLTHAYDSDFPTFDGKPGILYEVDKNFEPDGYHLFKLTIFEHTGTHIDAPLHFSKGGASVDALPVEQLIAPLCILDISAKAAQNPNATVEPADIEAWMPGWATRPGAICPTAPWHSPAFPRPQPIFSPMRVRRRSVWIPCRSTPGTLLTSRCITPGCLRAGSGSKGLPTLTSFPLPGRRSLSARRNIAAAPAALRASWPCCERPLTIFQG